MSENSIFQPLPTSETKELTGAIEIGLDLIAITLVTGDVLLGCLEKYWNWNGKTIGIGFNTEKGFRYGQSNIITIPVTQIANIQKIPLDEESIPRIPLDDPSLVTLRELGFNSETLTKLTVQDYPNPLASIICNHNLPIADRLNLKLFHYMELSLPKEAIPKEGIALDSDILLYANWDFFSQQMAGNTSLSTGIPGIGLSKSLNSSLQTEVIRRLRNTFLGKGLRKGTSSSAVNELWVHGCIFVPEKYDDTIIEGEKYVSVFCVSSENDAQTYPVLLALKYLKYPLEFLGNIVSPLNFYGEVLPIPLNILGENYNKTLLARAIGYFHK